VVAANEILNDRAGLRHGDLAVLNDWSVAERVDHQEVRQLELGSLLNDGLVRQAKLLGYPYDPRRAATGHMIDLQHGRPCVAVFQGFHLGIVLVVRTARRARKRAPLLPFRDLVGTSELGQGCNRRRRLLRAGMQEAFALRTTKASRGIDSERPITEAEWV